MWPASAKAFSISPATDESSPENTSFGALPGAAAGWKRLGAQMVMLYPMYRMPTVDQQVDTLRRFREVVDA